MKHLTFLLCFIFVSCMFTNAQPGYWTWMHGSNGGGSTGNFGTQGIPSATNTPPAVYEGAEWTDLQGNFWLFGGLASGFNEYGDLWKYDPTTNMWTWMKGTGTTNSAGVWGIQGVPNAANRPSARAWGVANWIDSNGDLWMYGGNAFNGVMSDLWKYNIATNMWTWVQGSNSPGQNAVYGTLGIPNAANTPGKRFECSATWVDSNDNLWLFGGYNQTGNLSDVWKYDPLINQWTWMAGSNTLGQTASWGVQGIPSPTNTPGARQSYCRWKDSAGNFWLFGGMRYPVGSYNDLWQFDPATLLWTWMGGTTTLDHPGIYGPQCIPSVSIIPPARLENRCAWTDANNNFWLYGGGQGTSFQTGYGDLWMYNHSTSEWTFASGITGTNTSPVFGTLGIPSATNFPGTRCGNIGFNNNNGYLYMFGGTVNGWLTPFNDLWRFQIDPNCPPTVTTLPVAAFATADTLLCQNDCINFSNASLNATTYQWTFSGAQTVSSTLQYPVNICYGNTGTFDVQLIACNAIGCDTLTFTAYIKVDSLPQINLGSDTLICNGDSILLDAGAGFDSYLWSNNSTQQSIVVSTQGNYFVSINSGACSVSDSIFISTQPCNVPIISLSSSDTLFCEKQCIDFFDLSTNNPTSWQWFFTGAQPDTSTLQNPVSICFNNYGSYDVTLIACNANGCDTLTFTDFINCFPNPVDSIYQSNDTLYSMPADSYQWYETSSGIITGETNQYFVITQPGSYYCVITDSIGCVATSNSIVITSFSEILNHNSEFIISPNPNDGSFTISLNHEFKTRNCMLRITDNIGQIVFQSNSVNHKMNISLPLSSGIYFVEVKNDDAFYRSKMVVN